MTADRRTTIIQTQGHVLSFDNNTRSGRLVVDLWIKSHLVGTYDFVFGRQDLHLNYAQPQEGDRVQMRMSCGYDNQPWYIVDGSLRLVCRATPIPLANAT